MRSPIEHEPDYIQAIGIVTVRWSLMEHQLANLLTRLMRSSDAAMPAYFSLGSFSQRLALVSATAQHSIIGKRESNLINSLFRKIDRLWKTRNSLMHSHYVHETRTKGGGSWTYQSFSMELGEHPKTKGPALGLRWLPHESLTELEKEEFEAWQDKGREIEAREFGYLNWGKSGFSTFVPVNLGTFNNHANALSKRVRQVATVGRYIDYGVINLSPAYDPTLNEIPSPRSPRNRASDN